MSNYNLSFPEALHLVRIEPNKQEGIQLVKCLLERKQITLTTHKRLLEWLKNEPFVDDQELLVEVKRRAELFMEDNYSSWSLQDFKVIETAMLIGASIVTELQMGEKGISPESIDELRKVFAVLAEQSDNL